MAAAEVITGSPLAEALQSAVQPKLAENGWSSGATDDSALSEYIILMLANGKTQEQIASELANDLLGLDPSDPSPSVFAAWLFDQVNAINAQLNGGGVTQSQPGQSAPQQPEQSATFANGDAQGGQDAEMGGAMDTSESGAVPTGPKSMRTGAGGQRGRDRRMAGHMRNALDRKNDNGIHRIKGAASRISSHGRDAPSGPRNMSKMQNAMTGGGNGVPGMNPAMMANMAASVDPSQQMALFQMLEQQSQMMAQLLGPQGQAAINPKFFNNRHNNRQGGKSLFDRVDRRGQNGGNHNNRPPRHEQNGHTGPKADGEDTDMTAEGENGKKSQGEVLCKYQLQCTNATCPFAHQGPATPPGANFDVTDVCSFGAACKNPKCAGSHPSPAQKRQYLSSTVDCKFYPNCTNPSCPFRHPSAPPCRNGADCPQKDSGCKFSHSTVQCRYNPCLNPRCVFAHEPGQKQGNTWTKDGGEHVSERKFVSADADGKEELIVPGQAMEQDGGGAGTEQQEGVDMQVEGQAQAQGAVAEGVGEVA